MLSRFWGRYQGLPAPDAVREIWRNLSRGGGNPWRKSGSVVYNGLQDALKFHEAKGNGLKFQE
jgi:hypothetical protein